MICNMNVDNFVSTSEEDELKYEFNRASKIKLFK